MMQFNMRVLASENWHWKQSDLLYQLGKCVQAEAGRLGRGWLG